MRQTLSFGEQALVTGGFMVGFISFPPLLWIAFLALDQAKQIFAISTDGWPGGILVVIGGIAGYGSAVRLYLLLRQRAPVFARGFAFGAGLLAITILVAVVVGVMTDWRVEPLRPGG